MQGVSVQAVHSVGVGCVAIDGVGVPVKTSMFSVAERDYSFAVDFADGIAYSHEYCYTSITLTLASVRRTEPAQAVAWPCDAGAHPMVWLVQGLFWTEGGRETRQRWGGGGPGEPAWGREWNLEVAIILHPNACPQATQPQFWPHSVLKPVPVSNKCRFKYP